MVDLLENPPKGYSSKHLLEELRKNPITYRSD
jgi:hypothetical protein